MSFNDLVAHRCEKIQATLCKKEEEYAINGDRFHNFRVAARMDGETPEKALKGMWLKHLVSVFDMIAYPGDVTEYMIDEKIGDCINYLILLEGLLRERIDQ